MKKTKFSPVCIAGAHRSGTSMLTRLLREAGLELGAASDMMPAQEDNPDGFWENLRFVRINEEVLNELGGAWDVPPAANEDFTHPRLQPLKQKATVLIESFADGAAWGWKDPRNSLTLPFWKELLPELKVVVMVRNPLEAAYSMHKRNGTSYAFGLRLWELYNRRLLATSSESRRLIASYDDFFKSPERELRRVARFLGLPADGIPAAILLVARNRRHTSFTLDQLMDARVAPEIIELYRDLITLANENAIAADGAAEIPPTPTVASVEEFLPGSPNRLRISVPDREGVREELAALRGAKLEYERLLHELPRLRQIAQQEGRIQELHESLASKEREIGSLRDRFLQLNHLLQSRSLSLAEHERRVADLTNRLRELLDGMASLVTFLERIEAAAARLRWSRRWKLSNPIATLRSALFGRRLLGPGDLERNVAAYAHWKEAHAEKLRIEAALQSFQLPPTVPETLPAMTTPRVPQRPVEFPVHEDIEISIIIPVFNQLPFTQACLASIQEHAGQERFEVIVVDDFSSDTTQDEIPKMPGLVYVRNGANAGFIASSNRGAQQARGEFLVFLNNDTQVTPGWLASLRETFEIHPRAGLVGAKLVYPDGRLQEAGGVIWRNATGWNYGKGDDPGKPSYNFLREVDYCSGACVMIRKSLFESLGGFDSKYAPAYYEDVDLAFKVRRDGHQVLYQPLSEVIHFEGATNGTNLATGTKKYQEINRSTFGKAWADVLADKPVNGDIASWEKPANEKERVLVIDHHLPMPDRDAGSLRMFNILVLLQRLGHRVTFLPDNLADIPPYTEELQKRGVEVVHHPFLNSIREYIEEKGSQFDTVILSRCEFARKNIADVRACAPQSRVIFDTVDLHFLRQDREADLLADPEIKRLALERRTMEYDLIKEADETWVCSNFEQELLRSQLPDASIEVMSMIVDVPGSARPFSLRQDFLFIGSFQHTPNVDAVVFFVREILPLVQAQLPSVKFYVIGDKAPPAVTALASENVIITGQQPDLRPYFESVILSVAPLRFGAGVKGKINQSMGYGVPVVATSLAAEGMSLVDREDILIADAPEDFAQAVLDLYRNEDLWERISRNGLAKTKSLYSPEAGQKQLARLIGERPFSSDSNGRGNAAVARASAERLHTEAAS